MPLSIAVPRPCARSWAAMPPTADGRHCAACQTEVVDFTRLNDAEILAYLAQRRGQSVCAYTHGTPAAPPHRWRRWLLAGLALLGWAPQAPARPPVPGPPLAAAGPRPAAPVVVRGQVFDDQNGQPVSGLRVLIKDTKYGTATDARGRFELAMAATWAPLKSGTLTLHLEGRPFDFQAQDVRVRVGGRHARPAELKITLQSIPDRGRLMGKIRMPEPPVPPPRN